MGSSDFVTIESARTAIGHDAAGRIMLVSIEGKSRERGLGLIDFARLLISLGAHNAINLDGGGSAQVAVNSTIVNYPSDSCSDNPRFHCERPITTIACFLP